MAVEIPCFIRFPAVLFLPEDCALTSSGHVKKNHANLTVSYMLKIHRGFWFNISVSTGWNFYYKLFLTFLLDDICSDNTKVAAPVFLPIKESKIKLTVKIATTKNSFKLCILEEKK